MTLPHLSGAILRPSCPLTFVHPLATSHAPLMPPPPSPIINHAAPTSPRHARGVALWSSRDSVGPDGKARKSSFYKRPSKAIEMGGGFFIPGLEGYRLRLAVAALTLALLALNRFPGYNLSANQVTSEAIGALAAFVLLLQALLQKSVQDQAERALQSMDQRGEGEGGRASSSRPTSVLGKSVSGREEEDDLEWVGFALSENADCEAVVVVDGGELVYFRGPPGATQGGAAATTTIATTVMEVLKGSSLGGGVLTESSLPGDARGKLASMAKLPPSSRVLATSLGGGRVMVGMSSEAGFGSPGGRVWFERAAALLRRWSR